MNNIARLRNYRGPAVLSYGFRPFFLLASLNAGIAILGWLPMLNGNLALPTALAPRDWHIHEMLYGYLPAVITGFLLTAIPELDQPAAHSGQAASHASIGLDGRALRRRGFAVDRLVIGSHDRCIFPAAGHSPRGTRNCGRRKPA